MKPLRIESRIKNITTDGDPGLPEIKKLSVSELPESAKLLHQQYTKWDEYATLSAFLSLQAYFSISNFEGSKSVLCYILRVKEACGLYAISGLQDKNVAGRIMLGMDALAQLARIPDILTSPICSQLHAEITKRLSHGITCCETQLTCTDLDHRLNEEAYVCLTNFRKAQAEALDAPRIDLARERYFRWVIMTSQWLKSPSSWHSEAEDALREANLNDGTNQLDPTRDHREVREVISFYSKTVLLEK